MNCLTPLIFVMFAVAVPRLIPALTCQADDNKAYRRFNYLMGLSLREIQK